jgi:hypothetical protein
MPGKYHLRASHRDFDAGSAWIEVTCNPDPGARTHFDFEWGEGSYQIRRVGGQLSGKVLGNTGSPLQNLVHPQSTTHARIAIALQDAFGSDGYQTVSDSTGRFFFDHVPDGIYILHIDGGMNSLYGDVSDTAKVIDLSQSSKTDFLDFEVQPSGCGAPYFDLKEAR